ncbi:hypothetical protein DFJ73DRAFT_831674 [Zopfochytrium polystomum]|nr:hypothetical protein DFJ73DRAFT_831674 [Zopfochytrium polystomum]
MKAIVVEKWLDSVDALRISTTAPDPVAGDGSVVVAIHSIGLNFFDILMVQGKYQIKPPFPFIPGAEFAGVITQVGKNVTGFKVGDRVFGSGPSYAEKIAVAVNSGNVFKIPESLSTDEAAAVFMNYPTSWLALEHRGQLKKGEVCLIHAAAGGVGSAAIHIAKYLGATVIATAGSDEKCAIAKREGADYVINYSTDTDWAATVNKITGQLPGRKGQKGADVIYDPVGTFIKDTSCVAWNGRILVIGFAGTGGKIEAVPANRLLLKGASLVGVFFGGTVANESSLVPKVWEGVFKLLSTKKADGTFYKPLVYKGQKYAGLESIPEALKDLGGRKSYGKVVVDISPNSSAKL